MPDSAAAHHDSPLRFALVGSSGFAANMPAQALVRAPSVEFAGVLGSTPERGASLVNRLGVGRAYSSLDELLLDASVDAVWIAAHDLLHCPMTLSALDAGKHVLVEKPMAVSVAEGRAMVSAAQLNDR